MESTLVPVYHSGDSVKVVNVCSYCYGCNVGTQVVFSMFRVLDRIWSASHLHQFEGKGRGQGEKVLNVVSKNKVLFPLYEDLIIVQHPVKFVIFLIKFLIFVRLMVLHIHDFSRFFFLFSVGIPVRCRCPSGSHTE